MRFNLPLLDDKNLKDRVVDEIKNEPRIGKKKLTRAEIEQLPDFEERCEDIRRASEEL